MSKVFVDTNCFIELAYKGLHIDSQELDGYEAFISVLSCHILFYVNKQKVPSFEMNSFIEDFNSIPFDDTILKLALQGPTEDLEDNIQLHSAAKINAEFFITFDKKLLAMKFFGRTQIIPPKNLKG